MTAQTLPKVDFIVVHCSASPEGRADTIETVRRWHREKGWRDIGYHYVVELDGTVKPGRPDNVIGAHAVGVNERSIGICYIGGLAADAKTAKDTRTPAQKAALRSLLVKLRAKHPKAPIIGHRDVPGTRKACPSFNAKSEYADI